MLFLDPGEHVVMEVRKHWFVFLAQGIGHFIGAVLPLLIYFAFGYILNINIPVGGNSKGILLFIYSIWLLVMWASFFVQWTKYYLDVWYVTEKRIIDVEQKALFDRSVSSLRFDRIQDITVDVQGIVATFLDIGDIRVQTASEDNKDFFIRRVLSPEKVRNFIFSVHNKESEKSLPVTLSNNGTKEERIEI